MSFPQVKYAIYPGPVDLVDDGGHVIGRRVLTAEQLAELYGVSEENYLVVEEGMPEPQGMAYFEYIHLKPRADDKYIDMKKQIDDKYRPDFDGSKRWTDETDLRNIDPEILEELDFNKIGGFR